MTYVIKNTNNSIIKYALAIFGAMISAFICLPYSKDGEAYKYIYQNILEITEIEYLFRLLLQLGLLLDISFEIVLMPLIFTTLLLKLNAFGRLGSSSVYMYIAYIAFFFLLHDCSQYRISAALAFALWSCVTITRREWVYTTLLIVLAFGFHITAVMLPLVFGVCIYSGKVRKFSWWFLILGFFVYLLNIPVMSLLTSQAAFFLGGRYLEYTGDLINDQNTSGLVFVYAILLAILLMVAHYWARFKIEALPSSSPILLATSIYGCGMLFWLYETVAVASRLSDVLLIAFIPLLGIIISRISFIYRIASIFLLSILFYMRLLQLFLY